MSPPRSGFQVDPSWPTILDLAERVWGQPTAVSHDRNEIRFGSHGSKSVKVREAVFHDHEPNGAKGGYRELWSLAYPGEPLPPRTNGHAPPPAAAKPNSRGWGDGLKSWEHVERAYDYRAADGTLIAQAVRMKPSFPHRFTQRRPDGLTARGEVKWKWSTSGMDIPLYRWPQVSQADPAAVVWLSEGEKDADRLAAAGLISTTNVAGAKNWNAKRNGDLAGRHVVILEDNDDAGRARSAQIAPALIGIAASVRVLALPDLPEKGDVSDWLDAGGTIEELERLARETPEYQQPAPSIAPTPDHGQDDAADPVDVDAETSDQDCSLSGVAPEAPEAGQDKPPAKPEPFGPPTLDDLTIADLARLDGITFGQIATAKAALLSITPTHLRALVSARRSEIKARAKAREREARRQADADRKAQAAAAAKAAKAQAAAAKDAKAKATAKLADDARAAKQRARDDKEAIKRRERDRKAAERQARLDAQAATTLVDDEADPLHTWRPPDRATLPEILVAGGERPFIADAALAAMKTAGVPFYTRGRDLVRVCLTKMRTAHGATVLVPAVTTVTKPVLSRALGLTAIWWGFDKDNNTVRIDPPDVLCDHVLGMSGEWPFPPLRGVIATQTMRFDGSLLTKPGYDPATGLMLSNPPPMAAIPDKPTKQDALEALDLLNGLFEEVIFEQDENVSRSAAMSMLMTPVLRGSMSVAPLHIVNKPAPGSGGSYMQDLMAAIAIGEACPVLSLTLGNDEENEKRLAAAAISGQSLIAIDNFTGTLLGDFLCQLVERPMPQVRPLGRTELINVPNTHCVFANGNNAAIAADMVRRTLRIGLDPNVENPADREFKRDPVAEVLADRGKYIRAILVMARAYRVAGLPNKLKPRLSFGDWSDNVRSPLVWLGWPDCDLSIKAMRAADPRTNALVGVINAWIGELQIKTGYSTGELVKTAEEFDGMGERRKPALWDALFAAAGNNQGRLDPAALGRWLDRHINRVVGDHKLLVDRETNRAVPHWSVTVREAE